MEPDEAYNSPMFLPALDEEELEFLSGFTVKWEIPMELRELAMQIEPRDRDELPMYQCHKKVRAVKIREVHRTMNKGATLYPVDTSINSFYVSPEFVLKHNPEQFCPGGYFVVYEDGYTSFSPQKAFEDGYTLLGEPIRPIKTAE